MRNWGHQTRVRRGSAVRLEPGSHRTPYDGVCIVELASIIGGERFSDRPRCVCRVLAAFLRGWNDRASYADRQRLEPYAALVVGTRGYRRISRIRRDICLSWAGADLDRGPLRRVAARLRMRARIAWTVGVWPSMRLREGAGAYAARVCIARGGADEAFALLDRLLGVGSSPTVGSSNGNGNGNGNGHRGDELAIRAGIIARERRNPEEARTPSARGSGSLTAADGDRPPDSRARPRGARSSG
jgi:hypothetical protein